jgi:hypothetical protein
MEHRVKHDLGRALARRATEAALKEYSEMFAEYEPRTTWHADDSARVAFTVKGMSLKGAIGVHEHHISIDLDVPFLLKPFRAKALDVIEREIRKWVDKARRGELP